MVSMTHRGLRPNWTVRGTTFLLWGLAILCVVYWSLKLSTSAGISTAPSVLRTPPPVDTAAVARLLGGGVVAASPAAPSMASRFVLQGIVANHWGGGAALIAVDGKPARPFRVGTLVEEGLVLQSLQGRRALLGAEREGLPTLTLELPSRQPGP